MLKRLYLIQRLTFPHQRDWTFHRYYGFSDEKREELQQVFSPEYMGRAEFEGGKMADCFETMFSKWDEFATTAIGVTAPNGKCVPVYVLGLVGMLPYIVEDIVTLSKLNSSEERRERLLKEPSFFQEALRKVTEDNYDGCRDIVGWLDEGDAYHDLVTGCAFFLNKDMFDKFVKLFPERDLTSYKN
jgi:hypothetical protein